MSEPKPVWNKDLETAPGSPVDLSDLLQPAIAMTLGQEMKNEGLVGLQSDIPTVPIADVLADEYCCDEMREATEAGAISDNEIEYNEIYKGDISTRYFPINFCPFCGTAVGGGA